MSILAFQMPEKVVMEKSDDFHGLFTFKPLEKGYGVTIGNALEFYDFLTYAFFSIQIGHAFFPSQSAYGSRRVANGPGEA